MKLDQEKIREILLKENYIEKSGAEKADEFVKTGEGDFFKVIILDMRNKFSDIIRIYDTVLFYEEPKSNFIPVGIFEYD